MFQVFSLIIFIVFNSCGTMSGNNNIYNTHIVLFYSESTKIRVLPTSYIKNQIQFHIEEILFKLNALIGYNFQRINLTIY